MKLIIEDTQIYRGPLSKAIQTEPEEEEIEDERLVCRILSNMPTPSPMNNLLWPKECKLERESGVGIGNAPILHPNEHE